MWAMRRGLRQPWTRSRSARANTARAMRVNPLRGKTTVSRAEARTAGGRRDAEERGHGLGDDHWTGGRSACGGHAAWRWSVI